MRSGCPVAWTDAHDGFWVTSTYADVFAASRDDHTFSSRNGVVIPSESARLARDESFMASFCEEMLRYFSPVQGFARTVTKDTDLGGCALRRGDRVFLSWAAANHDPLVFDQPEEIIPDRFPNRHTSFGVGAHRCIGSTLARAEFGVVVREVLVRIPDYSLADGAVRYLNIGTANGWHRLPARFTPGKRAGREEIA